MKVLVDVLHYSTKNQGVLINNAFSGYNNEHEHVGQF
jgi:hypothetical protein